MENSGCKICKSTQLQIFAHTAKCRNCGILLYYPYPDLTHIHQDDNIAFYEEWYYLSCFFNHTNFTHMLRFAVTHESTSTALDILDFGGGGGQFALVCKSHFPNANVHIVDINDDSVLIPNRILNRQIPFSVFPNDPVTYDMIFLNDVFEHVEDPLNVLSQLTAKLRPGGKIFIDTPRQFWIYPVTKMVSKSLYQKVLRGTVSTAHLQIWSSKAFQRIVDACGLRIIKRTTWAEFTMRPEFYLQNMGITNPVIRFMGILMYRSAAMTVRNKLICLLEKRA